MLTAIKSTEQKKDEYTIQPGLWRIVLHADTKSEYSLVWIMMHVLRFHADLSIIESGNIAQSAYREGRAAVREGLTKEVAETILSEINSCDRTKSASRFAFKLEKQ